MAKGMGFALSGFTQGLRQGEEDVRRQGRYDQQQNLGELLTEKARFGLDRAKKEAPVQDELNRLKTEKAGFGLDRMRTKAQRTDQEYERATAEREDEEEFENALRPLVLYGDPSAAVQYANKNSPYPGVTMDTKGNEDGTFDLYGIKDGGEPKLVEQGMSKDELGRRLLQMRQPKQAFAPPETEKLSEGQVLLQGGKPVYKNPKTDDTGPGGVKTADYNSLKGGLRDMFTRMDPEGNIFMPEGSDEEYGKALEIGNDLIARDIPIGRASRMAYAAVRGPLSDDEARERARMEARKQDFGWGEGDKEQEFIERRAQELKAESEKGLREYERIMRGQQQRGRGLPGASGRQGAPGGEGAPKRGTIDRSGQSREQPRNKPDYPQSGEVRLEGGESLKDKTGTPITWEDVHTTANKHGMTVDQVLQRLRGSK